jgi:prepilin-type N-terminal cleavage/methylation domain-containing protein
MTQRGGRQGFTLLEIIVVVSISMLLSTLVIVYSGSSRQQVALSVEAAKIAQVISRAKALTLSTYSSGGVDCGYGVKIDYASRQYQIESWTSPGCNALLGPTTSSTGNFPLAAGVTFGTGPNRLEEIMFVPPDPVTAVVIGGAILQNATGKIYLQTMDGSATREVTVSTAGQITF